MKIRTIKTPEELKQIYDMSKEYTNNHQTWREYLAKYRKSPNLFFGAWEGDKLVGEVFGYIRKDGICELHSIAVFGTEWKKGIGRELIQTFERVAKKYSSRLNVGAGKEAEGFYSRVGWNPRGLLAIYEHDKRIPRVSIEPVDTSIRRRDKTRFAFFEIPDIAPDKRASLEKELKADEVILVMEKKLQ